MTCTATTLKRALISLAATVGIAILAVPAGVSHAAVFPSRPSTGTFAAAVTQGPDRGAVLAGQLTLAVSAQNQLRGRLVVQSLGTMAAVPTLGVLRAHTLTSAAVVPVTGTVAPDSHVVQLSFNLGNGQYLRTRLTPAGTTTAVARGTSAASWSAQTVGPHVGDVSSIIIHIHIEGNGWSIDIYIKI